MYPLQRILVCLDLSPIDQTLMEYTAHLSKALPNAKVYFIHVSKKLEIPEEIKKMFPNITGPADEALEKGINDEASKYFVNKCDTPYEAVVKDGNETEQILKWSQVKEIDLIVMGLKKSLKGSGTNAAKITAICHASVLFVPENASFKLEKVMVPVDFSKNSAMAVDVAMALKKLGNVEVLLQNVYKVPVGYHYTGKEYVDFAIIMKHNAEKQMKTFLNACQINEDDVIQVFNLDEDDKPADVIFTEAKVQAADMIILGSKGRTMVAALLMGSVAVELLRANKEIPYMIVKDKKANMGFMQAFKNL
ncbi:universal stress protein [uncultured Imperialibacter sp.]|uniref:universal stress protein n=1 Tax=uncultured Imperialibacter sp. TaxID=1672639 RepID=UPI0030D8EEC5